MIIIHSICVCYAVLGKLFTLILSQTRKTSVHLKNTNEDIFDEIPDLSDPSVDSKGPTTINVQKRGKDIINIIHVASGVQP